MPQPKQETRLVIRTACLATFALLVSMGSATAEQPVPIEEEPRHALRFENGHVRFFDVRLPAGYVGTMHIHHHDGVFVNIAPSETEAQDWGKPAVRRPGRVPGESSFIGYAARPKAHRVSNVGTGVYHVTDTEVLKSCRGLPISDDAAAGPVLVDNAKVRVTRIDLEPGASTRLHGPCGMLVAVTPGLALLATPGGAQQLELNAAGFAWRDHSAPMTLTNIGGTRVHFVDILVK
jgi:hypothetical protein